MSTVYPHHDTCHPPRATMPPYLCPHFRANGTSTSPHGPRATILMFVPLCPRSQTVYLSRAPMPVFAPLYGPMFRSRDYIPGHNRIQSPYYRIPIPCPYSCHYHFPCAVSAWHPCSYPSPRCNDRPYINLAHTTISDFFFFLPIWQCVLCPKA